MKNLFIPLLLIGFLSISCSKDEIPKTTESSTSLTEEKNIEVEKFIFRGMNEIYLYKADVPELADDYFSDNTTKDKYLASFNSPEDLYDVLQSQQDKFSFMTSDYVALEKSFQGVATTNGMKFGLTYYGSGNDVLGYVQYVLPGTSAEEKGVGRGDVFTEINGINITGDNYSELLGDGNYTINLGRIENGYITMSDQTVSLTAVEYSTNPVLISKVLEVDGQRIGYIMYNSFTADYDDELNAAFADLKGQGITELVLDLRYNGGGSVESAVDLSSMITGQFEGQIFMKEEWNQDYQTYFEANNPEYLLNKFNNKIRTGETINSLNLSRVHVLTTNRSASASELVINGLIPYIDVVQVGETTIGKFQASVTLYDSRNFGRENANKNHTYAIQPLVLKSVNRDGTSDYVNGLNPDITKEESLSNLGVLGDPTEPLLEAAINDILGKSQAKQSEALKRAEEKFKFMGNSEMLEPTYQRMYIDEFPSGMRKELE